MSTVPLPIEKLAWLFTLADGKLFWQNKPTKYSRRPIGSRAGTMCPDGYRRVVILQVSYLEHRIIFAMANGRWPDAQVDHINMDRVDNRPCNLREATHDQNRWNTIQPRQSTTGVKGVCWRKREKKFIAYISVNKKKMYLGAHDDLEFARFVRECATEKYHREFGRANRNGGHTPLPK